MLVIGIAVSIPALPAIRQGQLLNLLSLKSMVNREKLGGEEIGGRHRFKIYLDLTFTFLTFVISQSLQF